MNQTFIFQTKTCTQSRENDVIINDVIFLWKIIFRLRPYDFQNPRLIITVQKFQWYNWSNGVQLTCPPQYVAKEKRTLRSREISMLTLRWWHFSRFILDLCFLTSEKEDNAVKLLQYLEIFYNRFFQERCF